MTKWYGSFLLRWWHLDDENQRLEVEYIQTGARVRVASVAAALAWMSACDRSIGTDQPPAPQPRADHEEQ